MLRDNNKHKLSRVRLNAKSILIAFRAKVLGIQLADLIDEGEQ